MIRPREGHDLHISSMEPPDRAGGQRPLAARHLRQLDRGDRLPGTGDQLRVHSEIDAELYDDSPIDCLIDPLASSYPFQYGADEQVEIVPYRMPSYPHDGPAVQSWLLDLYRPGQLVNTSDLLLALNTRIFEAFTYIVREAAGVQLPCQTLAMGSGSCRDYAVFMMEAARHWGFAARFVTGYIQMGEGQHGATHAWVEIYLPGGGMARLRPDEQQARRRRACLRRRRPRAGEGDAIGWFLVGIFDRLPRSGSFGAGRGGIISPPFATTLRSPPPR